MKKKFHVYVDSCTYEQNEHGSVVRFESKIPIISPNDEFIENLLKGFDIELEIKPDLNKLSIEELEQYVKENKPSHHRETEEEYKTRVISEQALEISHLEKENKDCNDRLDKICHNIVACGGPLNDNAKKYTKEQLQDWFYVAKLTGRY